MPKIKADCALLKNAQHFGTDRSLIRKLIEVFGDDATVADILDFSVHDFMQAGLTGNMTMRLVKYLGWYGHKPKGYVYANKRTKQTNVIMEAKKKEPCPLHTVDQDYFEREYEKVMNDPWYQDVETECRCN